MFNHIPELLGLLVLGLILFGPKRMIEMGGQAGRMLRELRAAMKDMNWNPLTEEGSSSGSQTTLGKLSQLAQNLATPGAEEAAPAGPASAPLVVESTAQPTIQPTSDPLAE